MEGGGVSDDEVLYRRVRPQDCPIVDGKRRLTSQAFADRARAPSVDRARLRGMDPTATQQGAENAVVQVVAGEVRAIDTVVQMDAKGKEVVQRYAIDVLPDPIVDQPPEPDNLAHALISPAPEWRSERPFRRLLEALVRLAEAREWPLIPTSVDTE